MSTEPIRVLLVDDNHVVRMGLRVLLEATEGITVVGEASSGTECVQQVEDLSPDVVLLDVRMPGGLDGVGAAEQVSDRTAVLMLTYADDASVVKAALAAGAKGYLVHGEAGVDMIVDGIRSVAQGRAYLNGRASDVLLGLLNGSSEGAVADAATHRPPVAELLTAREREIMECIAQGLDNRAIAGQLYISGSTLKNHITRIFDKLGVNNRAEAIVLWLRGVGS